MDGPEMTARILRAIHLELSPDQMRGMRRAAPATPQAGQGKSCPRWPAKTTGAA